MELRVSGAGMPTPKLGTELTLLRVQQVTETITEFVATMTRPICRTSTPGLPCYPCMAGTPSAGDTATVTVVRLRLATFARASGLIWAYLSRPRVPLSRSRRQRSRCRCAARARPQSTPPRASRELTPEDRVWDAAHIHQARH